MSQKKLSIPIVLFSFTQPDNICKLVDSLRKKDVSSISDFQTFSKLFRNPSLNFICLEDVNTKGLDDLKLLKTTIFDDLKNEPYEISPDNVTLELFYMDSSVFRKFHDSGLEIFYKEGKYVLENSSQISKMKDSDEINDSLVFEYYSDKKPKHRFETKSSEDIFFQFLIFCVKHGMIQFLSMKEDYYPGQTMYPKTEDQSIKKTSILDELKAIIRYSVITNNILFRDHAAIWTSITLNNLTHGVSIIDAHYTLIYTNNKRRIRHKNNMLGKPCYQVIGGKDDPCEGCPFKRLFDEGQNSTQREDRHELRIKDKAENEYWLSESDRVLELCNGKEKIGISICRDINLSKEIRDLTARFERNEIDEIETISNYLKKSFVDHLGFTRLRIYLNYSAKRDSEAAMYLFSLHGEHEQKVKRGFNVTNKLLNQPYNENQDTIYKGFKMGKTLCGAQDLRIYDRSMFTKNTKDFNQVFDPLQLSAKWIDLPIWYNDQLFGVIGLDFGKNAHRWDRFTSDSIHQLLSASDSLATAIHNSLMSLSHTTQTGIIGSILQNGSSTKFAQHVCDKLTKKKIGAMLFFKIDGDKTTLCAYKIRKGFEQNVIRRIDPELSLPKVFEYVTDYKQESYSGDHWFSKVIDVVHYPMYSYVYLPMLDTTEKTKYAMLAIRLGNRDEVLPFLPDYAKTLEDTAAVINSRIQYLDSQEDTLNIIKNITDFDMRSTTAIDIAKKFDGSIKAYLCKNLPNGSAFVCYNNAGNMELISSEVYVPIHGDTIKRIGAFVANTPKREITVFGSKEQCRTYFTEEVTSQIGESGLLPFVYIPVCFNDKVIAFCIITQVTEHEFDAEFRYIMEASAVVVGNILGLLAENKKQKTTQANFVHDISNPIKTLTDTFDYMIPTLLGLDVNEGSDKYELKNVVTHKVFNVKSLFQYLQNVSMESFLLKYFAQNAAYSSFTDTGLEKKNFPLTPLINRMCRYHKTQIEKNKPELSIFWNTVSKVEVYGNEQQITLALLNLLDNAVKYSTPMEKTSKYKPVQIHGEPLEYDPIIKQRPFFLEIRNYGKTVASDEVDKVFDEEYRGSNAIAINAYGNGLGLSSAKKILENHGFNIYFEVDEAKEETTVTVKFVNTRKETKNEIYSAN